MKKITPNEIKEKLNEHINKKFKVDKRVFDEIEKPGSIYEFEMEDQDAFLSLIWHEIDVSRLLTPAGQPRTLKDIAERIINENYTSEQLAKNIGKSPKEHNPNWFSKCPKIDKEFKYENFGYVILTSATENESKQSPNGSFYIFDGSRRSMILAKKLLENEIRFQPIECVLLLPRRK